jgi:hypothetical protein
VLPKLTDSLSIRKFEIVGLILNRLLPAPKAIVPVPDIVPLLKVLLEPSNSSVPVETEIVPAVVA